MLNHNSASCIILKTPFLNFLSPKLCLFTWPACCQPQKPCPHCRGHAPVLLTQMHHCPLPVATCTSAPPFPMRLLPNSPAFPLHWTSLSQPCHPLKPPFFFFVAKDLSLKISLLKKAPLHYLHFVTTPHSKKWGFHSQLLLEKFPVISKL